VADGWCWFVLREEYCWLVADGWFVLREKYCWLVADKPSEQAAGIRTHPYFIFILKIKYFTLSSRFSGSFSAPAIYLIFYIFILFSLPCPHLRSPIDKWDPPKPYLHLHSSFLRSAFSPLSHTVLRQWRRVARTAALGLPPLDGGDREEARQVGRPEVRAEPVSHSLPALFVAGHASPDPCA
jgi:hypothetical protein